MADSRISGLFRQSVAERIDELQRRGWLASADAELLRQGRQVLSTRAADSIIENVIGVFGLPLAVAPNFIVNGRDYIVPVVVEEPSIVAAMSNAARMARSSGGFTARCEPSLLAGQIHLTGIADSDAAERALLAAKDELLDLANAAQPRLVARGGGARDIELRRLQGPAPLVLHLLVDTCDAMGANLVNTMCEAIAPRVAEISAGEVALRILSNLADSSLASATVSYPVEALAVPGFAGEQVRDGVILASEIAAADPYRAATHNKGIMNGMDALALATGNDWRALEAGAHAYAARAGGYAPLAVWSRAGNGDLLGELSLPVKIGTVGGTLGVNPAAELVLRMTGVQSARELAELMAAVGLAQNLAAIRALATRGIQEGHMRLHARSAAHARRGHVRKQRPVVSTVAGTAAGKVILLGEHAAVYGYHALALPVPKAIRAGLKRIAAPTTVRIPAWDATVPNAASDSFFGPLLECIAEHLGMPLPACEIDIDATVPPSMGLGSSAALAVALARGFAAELDQDVDDARINAIAFACEQLAHGTPSGVDNAVATHARPLLYSSNASPAIRLLDLSEVPPLLIAFGDRPGNTAEQVAGVRARRSRQTAIYDAIFAQMDALTLAGVDALQRREYGPLGECMNLCHGLLNAIGVSTPGLERMVSIARAAGAAGAKLTGSGGGGAVVALCPDTADRVASALGAAGYAVLRLDAVAEAGAQPTNR